MQKKTLRRIAFTVIAAPALAVATPALASADAYYSSHSSGAGHHGAYSHTVKAYAGDGHAWYYESSSHAGSHGAYSYHVSSGSHR